MDGNVILTKSESERLHSSRILWLTTIRDGVKPHIVPVSYVFINSKIYVCTRDSSIKINNVLQNENAAIALENTHDVIILECKTKIIHQPFPENITNGFIDKLKWDISKNIVYNVLMELSPQHKIAFVDKKA